MKLDIEGARRFHGHSCPGLTIGIRASELALREIGTHAADGKNAYTFIRRSDGRTIRITLRQDALGAPNPERDRLFSRILAGDATEQEKARSQQLRDQQIEEMLALSLEMMFDVQLLDPTMPDKAQIYQSVSCSGCGEKVMETRVRLLQGEPYCIPCFEARERQI